MTVNLTREFGGTTGTRLVGRSAERARLRRLLADAKQGRGHALVLRGEAGIGKTALLNYAGDAAQGFRILRVVGVEAEAKIPFAGLQMLLGPFADRLDEPTRQSAALRGALGSADQVGDRLLVGAGTLALLSKLADDGPLLCVVDDAHWFDQASIAAILFAVRRLHSDPVVVLFAARDGDRPFPAPGVNSLAVARLDDEDAAQLAAVAAQLPPELVARVVHESVGNPLAVLELAVSDRLHVDAPTPVAPLPAVGRLDEHFQTRLRALPDDTRRALLLAAANTGTEFAVYAASAKELGISLGDLEPAETERFIQITPESVVFRHPLIRAAAYHGMPLSWRLATHRALADSLGERGDDDRRAWHLAAAAVGADDAAAAALDAAASRAIARGAPDAASRAWARAADLTRADDRARLLVTASRAAYDAGELDRADTLATTGIDMAPARGQRAEAAWIRAQVAYEREGPARASSLALQAAEPVLESDPAQATAILTEATMCARDASDAVLLDECARMLARLPPSGIAEALVGLIDLLCGEPEAAVPVARRLMHDGRDGRIENTVERLTAGFLGTLIGADSLVVTLMEDHVGEIRRAGSLGWLPYAQEVLIVAQIMAGRLHDAEMTVVEATPLAEDLGQDVQVTVLSSFSAWLAAVRGYTTFQQHHDRAMRHREHKIAQAFAGWARAIAALSRSEPEHALEALEQVCEGTALGDVTVRAIPDHVEAAVRCGRPDVAGKHLVVLQRWAEATSSPSGAALVLRCRALTTEGADAQHLFEDSLEVSGCSPYDVARTQLAYGMWLWRHSRPSAARDVLEQALATFDRIGAHGLSTCAQAELTALGAGPRDIPQNDAAALTPQERQVVRLAAEGLTNREIGAQLFLSPRTVGHHLYKAYPKLGVSRRTELARLEL